MDIAHMIARVLGPVMVIFGIWFFTNKEMINKMAKIEAKLWGFHILGIMYMLIGVLSINLYNVWVWNAYITVTLVGWAIFLRGLFFLFLAQNVFANKPSKYFNIVIPNGFVSFIWGLILLWFGFFA